MKEKNKESKIACKSDYLNIFEYNLSVGGNLKVTLLRMVGYESFHGTAAAFHKRKDVLRLT